MGDRVGTADFDSTPGLEPAAGFGPASGFDKLVGCVGLLDCFGTGFGSLGLSSCNQESASSSTISLWGTMMLPLQLGQRVRLPAEDEATRNLFPQCGQSKLIGESDGLLKGTPRSTDSIGLNAKPWWFVRIDSSDHCHSRFPIDRDAERHGI